MFIKKSTIKWKIYFGAVIMVLPLLLVLLAFLLPAQYDETYLGELREKSERLESIAGEKLIVAGGSSVPFGIRSDLIEKELEMPVVDWGLYAPLGSRTMLEACLEEVKEGDIVVFSPEQSPETLSFSFQARELWQALDGNFSPLGVLRETELKSMLAALPEFAVSKLKYVLDGKPEVSGIYQRASFNEYGDLTASGREGNRMALGYDEAQQIDFSYFPEEEFVRYLNNYAARVQARGAKFYYRFCPMNELAIVHGEKVDEWFLRFDRAVDFTILGNPHQCIMESGWFFDTNFHLNAAGAIRNTYYFVRDLKAEFKDPTVTEIELPEMPQPLTENGTGRENADAECFVYEESGDRLIITGVNEKGADRQELAFPQEYRGKRVTAVQEGALRSAAGLKRIYICGGMALHDGCFDGCMTLKEIVLMAKPEDISVGRELLRGSGALLYTEYEDAYRLDYSWGLYSDKIKSRKMTGRW